MENIMIDSYAFSSLLANDDKFQMIDLIKKECKKIFPFLSSGMF